MVETSEISSPWPVESWTNREMPLIGPGSPPTAQPQGRGPGTGGLTNPKGVKEHAQWEQDLQASEMKQMGEAMEDLRRWRKEKPQAASEIARQRAAEAALSMEGHGGGSAAAASSQRGFGGLLEGGSEWE